MTARYLSLLIAASALAACGERTASTPAAAGPNGQEAGLAAAAGPGCDDFILDGPDYAASYTDSGTGVTLYMERASGWKFPDIRGGMFVGKLSHAKGSKAITPFEGITLTSRQAGCLRFRLVRQGNAERAQATFHYAGSNGRTVPIDDSAICWHQPHQEDVKPRHHSFPDDCRVLYWTSIIQATTPGWTGTTDTVVINMRIAGTSAREIRGEVDGAFRAALTAQKTNLDRDALDAAAKQEVGALFAGGLWFPCVFTGCCRAY